MANKAYKFRTYPNDEQKVRKDVYILKNQNYILLQGTDRLLFEMGYRHFFEKMPVGTEIQLMILTGVSKAEGLSPKKTILLQTDRKEILRNLSGVTKAEKISRGTFEKKYKSLISPKEMFQEHAFCNTWESPVTEETFLNALTRNERSVLSLTVRKEREEENAFQITLKVSVTEKTEQEAKAAIKSLITLAKKDYNCVLTQEIHNKDIPGLYPSVFLEHMIPFTVAEITEDSGLLYGVNLANIPVIFNRRDSELSTGVIAGSYGSGKDWNTAYEIQQILNHYEKDSVLIIDPDGDLAKLERISGQATKIEPFEEDSEYHINPLDIFLPESFEMDEASVEKIIMDISDIAFALIEAANGKWMNFSDASIIRAACWSTFRPFIHKLYEEKKTHDFENNPTFMDLFDVLQKRQAEDYLIDSLMKTLQEIKTPDNDVLAGRISNYLEECRNGSLKIICEIEDILSALKGYCHKTNIPEKQLIQISWQRSLARFWKVSYAVCSHFAKIHALANFYKTKNKLWVYASCADTIYSSDNSCAINELTELKRACISSENIFTAQVVEIEDIRKCGKGRAVFDYATFHLLLRPTAKDKEFLLENLKLPDLAVDSLADMQYGIILYKGNAVSLNLASGIKSINGSKEAFNL